MKSIDHVYTVRRKKGGVECEVGIPLTGHSYFLAPREISGRAIAFDFGYSGPCCNQLALAILHDFTDSRTLAERLSGQFMLDFILRWQGSSHEIQGAEIAGWIEGMQTALAKAASRQGATGSDAENAKVES